LHEVHNKYTMIGVAEVNTRRERQGEGDEENDNNRDAGAGDIEDKCY